MGHEIISPAPLAFFASRCCPEAPDCSPVKGCSYWLPHYDFQIKKPPFLFQRFPWTPFKTSISIGFSHSFHLHFCFGHFHLGVSINGGTPSSLYGFFSWKMQIENGWFQGIPMTQEIPPKKNNGAAWFFMFSPFACAMNTAKITAAKRLQSTRTPENVKRLPGWPWMAQPLQLGKY